MLKVVVIYGNEEKLKAEGVEFDNEIQWATQGALELRNIFEIPQELADLEPIETLWILKQVRDSLDSLVESGEISEYNEAKVVELVKILHDNHESVDQDLDWRIRDELGLES